MIQEALNDQVFFVAVVVFTFDTVRPQIVTKTDGLCWNETSISNFRKDIDEV